MKIKYTTTSLLTTIFALASWTGMHLPEAHAADLHWAGAGPNNNSGATANWTEGSPTTNTSYDVIYNVANFTGSRTATSYNTTGFGFSSLTISNGDTSFTLGGAAASLSGNVSVTAGSHTFNTAITTVTTDSEWNIATGATLTRTSSNTIGVATDKTITKTGGGLLVFSDILTGFAGTIALEQGTLSLQTTPQILGTGTLAVSGGVLQVSGNTGRDNSNAAVKVTGDATFRAERGMAGGGLTHTLGNLTMGAHTMTVTSSALMTNGTAGFAFGVTTLTGNATFDVVNGANASTNVSLGAVSGEFGITKTGNGTQTLTAVNTYTGNTTVSTGTLILNDNAELRLKIDTSGVNTQINGSGALTLNGDFRFDLTTADTTIGSFWNVITVDTLNESFGDTFQVLSTTGSFTNNNGIWTKTENGVDYQFSQATGILTVVPEPATGVFLMLAALGTAVFLRRHPKRKSVA